MRISKFTIFFLMFTILSEAAVMVYSDSVVVKQRELIVKMSKNPNCMVDKPDSGEARSESLYHNPDIYIGGDKDKNVKHFTVPPCNPLTDCPTIQSF